MFSENKFLEKCNKERKKIKKITATKKCIQIQKKYLKIALENFFENKKPYLMCSNKHAINPPTVMTAEQLCCLRKLLEKKLANYADISNHIFITDLANKISIWLCYMILHSGGTFERFLSQSNDNDISNNELLSIASRDLLPVDHYINYSAEKIDLNKETDTSLTKPENNESSEEDNLNDADGEELTNEEENDLLAKEDDEDDDEQENNMVENNNEASNLNDGEEITTINENDIENGPLPKEKEELVDGEKESNVLENSQAEKKEDNENQ